MRRLVVHAVRKPDLTMTLNGALAGLVAITSSCAFVEPWAAILFFGFLPGVVVVFSVLIPTTKIRPR